jgi:hypothetical protein
LVVHWFCRGLSSFEEGFQILYIRVARQVFDKKP